MVKNIPRRFTKPCLRSTSEGVQGTVCLCFTAFSTLVHTVTVKDGFYSHNIINNQCSRSRNAFGFISHVDQGAINVLLVSPQLQILFIFVALCLHLLDSDPSKGLTQLYLNMQWFPSMELEGLA